MPDRARGSNERRGLAPADEETKERVARKGGEASHGGRSSSGSSERGGSKGSAGAHYDPEVDRCRDEQGQFTECDDEKGGRSGSSGGSKGGSKGSSPGGSSGSRSSGGSHGRD